MSGEDRSKAEDAAAILENATFQEAFYLLDTALIERWRGENSQAVREEIFQRQRALGWVRDILLEHINKAAAQDARAGIKDSPWRLLWNKLTSK